MTRLLQKAKKSLGVHPLWRSLSFMTRSSDTRLARLALIVVFGSSCALFLAAPLLTAQQHGIAAGAFYLVFSPICHQIPGRSFFLLGFPWAVCQRCAGIYIGALLTALFYFKFPLVVRQQMTRRVCVIAALLPMTMDAALPLTGVWPTTPGSRLCTGLLFGAMLSSLLVPGISEFLRDAPWKRRGSQPSST